MEFFEHSSIKSLVIKRVGIKENCRKLEMKTSISRVLPYGFAENACHIAELFGKSVADQEISGKKRGPSCIETSFRERVPLLKSSLKKGIWGLKYSVLQRLHGKYLGKKGGDSGHLSPLCTSVTAIDIYIKIDRIYYLTGMHLTVNQQRL
jgi:hypothetical protein